MQSFEICDKLTMLSNERHSMSIGRLRIAYRMTLVCSFQHADPCGTETRRVRYTHNNDSGGAYEKDRNCDGQ